MMFSRFDTFTDGLLDWIVESHINNLGFCIVDVNKNNKHGHGKL
jgi:hypothetical protein